MVGCYILQWHFHLIFFEHSWLSSKGSGRALGGVIKEVLRRLNRTGERVAIKLAVFVLYSGCVKRCCDVTELDVRAAA